MECRVHYKQRFSHLFLLTMLQGVVFEVLHGVLTPQKRFVVGKYLVGGRFLVFFKDFCCASSPHMCAPTNFLWCLWGAEGQACPDQGAWTPIVTIKNLNLNIGENYQNIKVIAIRMFRGKL